MNEQDNTALVKKLYDAFSRGDIQTILDHLAPGVEWITEGPSIIPYAGRRVGPDKVRGFFDALGSTQENQKLTADEFIAQGDKVAILGRFAATVKATGKSFDTAFAHIFTIQSGKVIRFLDLFDTFAVAGVYQSTT